MCWDGFRVAPAAPYTGVIFLKSTKMKFKIILTILIFLYAPYMLAQQAWTNTEIKGIIVHDDGSENFTGEVHVVMQSQWDARPDCAASASQDRFVINMSRPVAKSQYSAVLSAYMASKPITVFLNNSCNGNVANLRNIILGSHN